MTPQYILTRSLCRTPSCAGPWELRDTPLKDWPSTAVIEWRHSAEMEIDSLRYAPGYAEPGYTPHGDKGILFANWNYFPRDAVRLLESAGFDIEWSDEWEFCEDCGKAFRTSPDSYGWQPSYLMIGDYTMLCHDCAGPSDIETYLEEREDNPQTAVNTREIDPAQYGYRLIEANFESGWHPGQNDDPTAIYNRLVAAGYSRLLFCIDGTGQFDVRFSVYTKIPDED